MSSVVKIKDRRFMSFQRGELHVIPAQKKNFLIGVLT